MSEDFGNLDRRGFLGLAGGALICTVAGIEVRADKPANLGRLGSKVPVPSKVANAGGNGVLPRSALPANRREYWIQAEPVSWNIMPRKVDQMMNQRVRKGRTKFTAWAYRAYSRGFAAPLGPATIPGPLLEATEGEAIVVNFRNRCPSPVTMHPHGLFYSNEMDGAYKGKYTDPGGFVQTGRTVTYLWECPEGTAGSWFYHDHGPLDPLPLYRGLFGGLVVRKASDPLPDREYVLAFHSFIPPATGLRRSFFCVNGRSFTGVTPDMTARVGDDVQMHVFGMDNDFHTFHLHGHRWTEPGGNVVDNKTFGPGDSFGVRFVEDNPGRWLYHCHVFSHLHDGMSGWYFVE